MPTERIQRQIDQLLDEIEAARGAGDWTVVQARAEEILDLDPANEDASAFLSAAERRLQRQGAAAEARTSEPAGSPSPPAAAPPAALPASFAAGRYSVKRLLGEGGRKRVFLARDTRLDRDVAFALVRADGLDLTGRQRVLREAQSVARLGQHPNLVTVHDIGEDDGNPYIVQEYMAGGDVAGLLAPSPSSSPSAPATPATSHQSAPLSREVGRGAGGKGGLPLERTLAVARDVCRGLAFIHAAGLVHRDLKPGNVFLASDGTAKVGDFGLAVALDRSRITQYGLMLGTVSYMPPEQALGGEVTFRADLYSLGAMLYEMVTGRPPFVGDDPTAVISQHINTPPVAPSWVTEHCPPSLEEVILQLLEKDPGKRPASATAVLAGLEAVDPSQKSATHSDSNVLERLARGVFVGREKELERLRKAFDEAFAGRGGLVMLVGEPGIGKTRTTAELETYARMRGALVLWGRAHESSGAPPYLPLIQVVNGYAANNDIAAIGPDLPPGAAAELSRIFPWLRDQPNVGTPEPIGDPDAAQFRLFDAYASTIRAIARRSPLMIVLDDLHWSDKPTLLLLQHLAREINRLRVLVVCTYRDTDLSRAHPLSEALAHLNREAGFLRIPLRGLSRAEVDGYIRAAANVSPPARLVDKIFEETEGNPFFLSEVVNLMTQEGTLSRDSVSDIAVPDGVREALGRRLDRISEEANELLQVCAVAGREFTYDTLTLLDERNEDQVLRLIEEAIQARVIEEMEQPGRYRFTHALMQETLLDELSTTRRVRLHGQVGEALEKRWGVRADERASRLAEHFVEAGMLSPRFASRAVHYAKLAAVQAESQAAWAEAAKWYEKCLMLVGEAEGELAEAEPELLLALGHCLRVDAQLRAAWRSLMRAITVFRERGNGPGVAAATIEALEIFTAPNRQQQLIEAALAGLGPNEPLLEAQLHLQMTELGLPQVSERAYERAAELAATHDYPRVRSALQIIEAGRLVEHGSYAEAESLFESAFSALSQGGHWLDACVAQVGMATLPAAFGRLDDASDAFRRCLSSTREWHIRLWESHCLSALAGISLIRCDFDSFERSLSEVTEGLYWADLLRAQQAETTGDLARAIALLPPPERAAGVPAFRAQLHGATARIFFHTGDEQRAATEMDEWRSATDELMLLAATGAITPLGLAQVEIDDCLPALGDDQAIESAYRDLCRLKALKYVMLSARALDVQRGALALRLGLTDEAEQWYREGLEWAERERCPIVAGRCHQGLAEVAVRRGNTAVALERLDRAATLFQQHGAKFYLDQVIAKKVGLQGISSVAPGSSIDRLQAAVATEQPNLATHAAPDGTVTLMFSDIEGSTPLNEQLGDAKWMELLRAHNSLIEEQVNAHGGYVVKTMGDGYMVAFKSAADGLRCALSIQQGLASTQHPALSTLRLRIGLHTGEAVRQGGDFFGKHVNLAARVGAAASGGEILVSGVVRELVAGQSFAFDDLGARPMKGFEEPVAVWAARWA